MRIPKTPKEAGLPQGRWYGHQLDTLEWIGDAKARVLFLDAPTASGKTLIGGGLQAMTGEPLYYAVWSRRLQQQAGEMLNAPIIMGRGNFDCLQEPEETCEYAWCDPVDEYRLDCPFRIQLREGQRHPLSVLNYAVLFQYMGGKSLEKRPWLVCDEGHKLEDALGNWLDVAVDRFWLEELEFPIPLPSYIEKDTMRDWAETVIENLHVPDSLNRRVAVRWLRVKHLAEKARALLVRADEVVAYEKGFVGYVRVIWPLRHFHKVLQNFNRAVLIMGATLGDVDAMATGMNVEDYETKALPSIIPVEQRKIYYRPVVSLNKNATKLDYEAMACGIIDIIKGNFPNDRGLIHVSSYQMAGRLGKHLVNRDPVLGRRILREQRPDPGMRKQWETRLDAPVLITPASRLGVDLPGLFPYQIIAKLPYPDLGDPLVDIRTKLDQGWYTRSTARDIVQTAGRVARNPQDSGVTVITDSSFERNVYERAPKSFPKWFSEALR